MNKFDARVEEVVDAKLSQALELLQDSAGVPSTKTIDDVYDVVKVVQTLTSDIKTEVNKLEHTQVPKDEDLQENSDEGTEDPGDVLDKLKKALDKADDIFNTWPFDVIPIEEFTKWLSYIKDVIVSYYKSEASKGGRVATTVISTAVRYWLLKHQLDPIRKGMDNLSSKLDKDYQLLISNSKQDSKTIRDMINRNNSHLTDLESAMITCCEDTHEKLDDILSKVRELQPGTTSNNTLEILAREKAIQAALEEIRGLL